MPHVTVKLWPGKSEKQKRQLTAEIAEAVMRILNYGDESVSVSFKEIQAKDRAARVYQPDIVANQQNLYKKLGYSM